jgi:hypothetical protein
MPTSSTVGLIVSDPLSTLFVIVVETSFPERGNPPVATLVREGIAGKLIVIQGLILQAIPAADLGTIAGDAQLTIPRMSGSCMLRWP